MNLQTLKAEKEKVEKGCGNDYEIDFDRYDTCEEGTLCPTCQARLEALNLGIQAVENTIKKTKDIIDDWIQDVNDTEIILQLKSQLQKEMTK